VILGSLGVALLGATGGVDGNRRIVTAAWVSADKPGLLIPQCCHRIDA
jgi:hypothetical protein